ncbi:hypothetical protein [Streptomyces sp. NRRL S-244]|uniref:hypothetical protein n=1 Tax=Streptomyces sp. NRRL S-244 TaxID=1463897 RepID=UPI0004C101EA|nr:hypothetical protein [Streptomyces sp. NRRL S-244]
MMDDHTPPGGAGEEQALRSLLRGAVEGLEPSDGALERLRHAVPVRRTRKRQALVGAAAAALLAGTAIPAALHLHITGGEGSAAEHSAMAGHGEQPGTTAGDGTSDPHQDGAGAQPRPGKVAGKGAETGGAGARPEPQEGGAPTGGAVAGPDTAGATAGAGAGTGPQPPVVAAPGVPGCSAEQLGVQGSAKAPEADGKVYGSFKVTNVSARGCTVIGPDTVTAASVSATVPGQSSGVTVVGHTAGDPAAGLPDPSAETPLLLLQPYTAYEVRFAWVPSAQSCPAATPDPAPKPPVGAPESGQGTAARADGPEPESGAKTPEPTGVEVTHTPHTAVPGAPTTTQTTIPAACGGTVYRTGVIPLDAPKP